MCFEMIAVPVLMLLAGALAGFGTVAAYRCGVRDGRALDKGEAAAGEEGSVQCQGYALGYDHGQSGGL